MKQYIIISCLLGFAFANSQNTSEIQQNQAEIIERLDELNGSILWLETETIVLEKVNLNKLELKGMGL